MLEWTASVQPLLLGVVLLWSACAKVFTRAGKAQENAIALAKLVGESRGPLAYRAVGAAEALLAAALLAPPTWTVEAPAAAALSIGFVGYLAFARIAVPGASCGCLGSANVAITWRSFARAGWMLAASVLALFADAEWWAAIAERPISTVLLVIGQGALFAALSAEFDRAWLIPLRRRWDVHTKPPGAGNENSVPLEDTVAAIAASALRPRAAELMDGDVVEHWDEADTRIVCYAATVDGRACTAVWAVPLHTDSPESIRVAFVDDETGETVLRLDGSTPGDPAHFETVPPTP